MARTSRTGTRTDLALLGAALAVALASLILPTAVRGKVQGSLRSTIAAPLVSAQAWAERGRSAIGDHGRLVNRVDSLAMGVQSTAPLRAENERLRSLLGLGQRLQWGFVATEVMHPPRGGDEHMVLLAAGSAAGVRPFDPLVVPEGLIGMVSAVDASSSTAILWTHPDFRASATTTDGVAFGIVAAHLGSGADRYLLEMRGVPFRSELKPGTMIVSSGLGNVFPRGIPIGVVLRETKTIEGWARTYLIRPIVSPDASTAAMVLLAARGAAGVTGAWSSAAASEGTQKAIAAAGDSILSDSVLKVQQKLALLDSLRRAAIYRGDSGIRVESDSAATRPASPVSPAPVTAPVTSSPVPLPSAVRAPPIPSAVVPAVRTPAAGGNLSTPSAAPAVVRPPAVAPAAAGAQMPLVTAPPPMVRALPGTAPKPVTTPRSPVPAATVAPAVARSIPRPAGPSSPPVRTTPAVQRDSAAARIRSRPRKDSAAAGNKRDTTKAPENPFRLPPAGEHE